LARVARSAEKEKCAATAALLAIRSATRARGALVTAKAIFALALLFSMPACGSSSGYSADDDESYASEDAEFDEDAARADAEEEVAEEGYDGPCTIDCSGHDAGFDWAAEGHDDYGSSSSQSFDEGQIAYEEAVDERVDEKRQEFEDEGADSEYAY
jgi:hypothetical protein